MKKVTATISILFAWNLAFLVPGMTATLSFGEAAGLWAQACGTDVERHCKGINPGNGRLAACLAGKASLTCQKATTLFRTNMQTRFTAQANVPRACKTSADRLCSNFQQGQGRVLRCLLRSANFRAANVGCKNQLRNAGWLDNITN